RRRQCTQGRHYPVRDCKSEVGQHCRAKAKQHDWKKKKLNQCLSQVGEACKDSCKKTKDDKKEEKSSTAPPPTGEKIEDNPCYGYCRNQCGGPEADACVHDCVQRASCTPQ